MRLIFLESTEKDLRWFKRYYIQVFSDDWQKAVRQFLATQRIILENPQIGIVSDSAGSSRECQILRTPFSVIYRIRGDNIEILRIVDNRSDWKS